MNALLATLAVLLLAGRGLAADLLASTTTAPVPASAYLVFEVTDLSAPRPAPFRVKALARRDGRAIARILWPAGDRGATLLVTPHDSAVYFARADLLVASPREGAPGLAGDLAGALAGAANLAPSQGRPDRCAGTPCLRWECDVPPASRCARLLAWKRPDGSPIRAACLDPQGDPRWEVRFGDAAPRRRGNFAWIESGRLRARGRVLYFEPGAPAPADLFTREGLRRWR